MKTKPSGFSMLDDDYSNLSVLVVDDFKQFHRTICVMLESFGVTGVDAVTSDSQALAHCKSKSYDIILCDYNLGPDKKNGQQLFEALRYQDVLKANSLFVMVTAEVSKAMVMATYDNHPDGYIVKPFNAQLLKQRLDKILAKRNAMAEINQAVSRNQPLKAIELCEEELRRGGRYRSDCLRLLGELYLKENNLERAHHAYSNVLKIRALDWAKVGLAHVLVKQGDELGAIHLLKDVLDDSPNYLPAYDALSDIYMALGEHESAQKVLEQAVLVSPLAIRRQQYLADVAAENHDVSVAIEAYKHSVELGEHSIFDRLDYYLGFSRCTAEMLANDEEIPENYVQKAHHFLTLATERFKCDDHCKAQMKLVQSQIEIGMKNVAQAEGLLHQAEKIFNESNTVLPIDIVAEWATTLNTCGHKTRCKELLDDALKHAQDNQEDLEKLDRLLDEPASQRNKNRLASVNRQGIGLYEEGRYKEAIDVFQKAKKMFPNFMAIRLNLVQAMNGDVRKNGYNAELMTECLNTLSYVESVMSSSDEQYDRFRQLYASARELNSLQ